MVDIKITDLGAGAGSLDSDVFPAVDTTDTTQASSGTTKKYTLAQMRTQLNAPVSGNVNAQTGTTYTLVAGDNGKTVTLNNASAIALSVPTGLPAGFSCLLVQLGAGQVTIGGGATLHAAGGALKMAAQYAQASVVWVASSNVFSVGGNLTT
jgi:hypothetical protein